MIIPDWPYHVTHRGNRTAAVFFRDADREAYLRDLGQCAAEAGLAIWGYCLMSNHIHLLAVPRHADALARAIGRAHRRHARRVNAAHGWTGHLWANRFFSTPLDEGRLWTAIKYIELNPVRADLVAAAADWPWSSARAHTRRHPKDPLLDPGRPLGGRRPHPLTGRLISWAEWLELGLEAEEAERLRRATSTGRPCGSATFTAALEQRLGRPLAPAKRGPKPRPDPPSNSAAFQTPDLFDP